MFELKEGFDYDLKNTFMADRSHIHTRSLEGVYVIINADTKEIVLRCYEYRMKGMQSCYITARNMNKAFTLSAQIETLDLKRNVVIEAFSKMYDFDSGLIDKSPYMLLYEAAISIGSKNNSMYYIKNEK